MTVPLRELSPPASGAPAEAASLRRALTAVLRWRMRRVLPRLVPARVVDAARLAPVLLHASFQHSVLRGDAPGVAGLRYRRCWSALARSFDLPPPWRAQRGAPLVEAVLALPGGEGLELVAVAASGIPRADLRWVEERAQLAQGILSAAGARCTLRAVEPADLSRDGSLGHRLALFGALAGGRLSPAAWAALDSAARRPLEARAVVALAARAPTPLAGLALTLLSTGPAPAPLLAAARLAQAGVPSRRLADPEYLCVRWAAGALPAHADALDRALEIAAETAPAEADGASEVLALGARLALPVARAIRRGRGAGLDAAARAAWRERVGVDLPRALLPALAARLAQGAHLETTLQRTGRQHEVRLRGHAPLGRGGSPVQARVRALSVLASAALEPLLAHAEPPWRALAARLARPRERPAWILVVEPAAPAAAPFDPLNHGPDRALGFPGALAVRLAPGRRPSARVLTAGEVIERILCEVRAGTRVEVLASCGEAQPVAARLAQVVGLLRERRGAPVALEAGGRAFLVRDDGVRRFRIDRLATRPRVYHPDPDAPDLSLSPGERRPSGLFGPSVIECQALPLDPLRAAVLYQDGAHAHLREVVFLPELEAHLREARAILQAADPRAVLAVRLADDLEAALRRAGPPGPPLAVAVRARFPHDLQVEVGGEWYGGSTGRTWWDAALALLDSWPRGPGARIAVTRVSAVARGRRRGGLLALYARALARRRLRTHLVRALRSYQDRPPRRSGG